MSESDRIGRTELWKVRSVIRKRSAMEPAEVAQHVIALEAEVVALRSMLARALVGARQAPAEQDRWEAFTDDEIRTILTEMTTDDCTVYGFDKDDEPGYTLWRELTAEVERRPEPRLGRRNV